MAPKVIVGMMGSSVAKGSSNMSTPEQVKDFLSVVKSHGVKELDTALVYNDGKSEELLASVDAQKDFLVSTKAPGFAPGSLTEANILSNSAKSHKNLQQDQVDIYYIHGPDKETPLQEQCQAFGKLYQQGRYQRFGVCNLSPSQIEEIHDICRREGFPPPSIYQGSYNAVHRSPEKDLFPTLRKLGMAFYAWGPLAGGLLVKELDDVLKPKPGSRYHEMPVFGNLYLNDHTIAALRKMHTICDENSVSMMEAALRWLMNHSPLNDDDGIILGASSKEQVNATLSACEKGPLPKAVVDGWQELWESIAASGKALPAFFS
ncbi:hypothetical protein LTS08_007683 [Lithohypha guttulata]|uniref:NADP-dependent oxidoreductase domain-containing protein n=1 Tax=Lithohypha guttulata TaxID=1690604 RepID=A0AAN7SEM5_9EURO|nr:hypothetical protein LTR05_008633 [Lithohypha guttulata]KAK5096427.1 hypothetical protein LTS08_007683 [Lithohypha guttulata]